MSSSNRGSNDDTTGSRVRLRDGRISVLQCYLTYNQEIAESCKQENFEANCDILALHMKGAKTHDEIKGLSPSIDAYYQKLFS
jgi:hypothetical protein